MDGITSTENPMEHDTFDHWLKTNYSRSAISIDGFTDADLRSAWLAGVDAAKEAMCSAIKAADDKASEGDYMLDSDDCISVIRGTWEKA
jgi:hypothetical protein